MTDETNPYTGSVRPVDKKTRVVEVFGPESPVALAYGPEAALREVRPGPSAIRGALL